MDVYRSIAWGNKSNDYIRTCFYMPECCTKTEQNLNPKLDEGVDVQTDTHTHTKRTVMK